MTNFFLRISKILKKLNYFLFFSLIVRLFFSPLLFSPMLWIAKYTFIEYYDGSIVSVCLTLVDSFWPAFYFVGSIALFFILPFLILLVLYTVIALHLMNNPGITSHGNRSNVLKYRKQVIFMLGAVVISFFICLLPFRALTLWIIIVPPETMLQLGVEGYYSLLYFCRILLYINSALNPILYNLMSSKFREGFLKLLGCKSAVRHKLFLGTRKGTFHTTSTNLSSSNSGDKRKSGRIKDDSDTITASIVIKNGLEDILVISSDSERSGSITLEAKRNGFSNRKRSTFEDIEEIEEIGSVKKIDGDDIAGTSNKKKCNKEVYFGHQNGRNGCNSSRRRSSSNINAHCKTQLLSAMSNKHSESIDSSADEIECYPEHHTPVYESRSNYTSNDDRESKLFIQHPIGTESFV